MRVRVPPHPRHRARQVDARDDGVRGKVADLGERAVRTDTLPKPKRKSSNHEY